MTAFFKITLSVDKVHFGFALELPQGQRVQVPFQLHVGQVEVPSLKIEHSSVRWFVEARLNVRMRIDPSVSQEISVWF